MYVDLKGFLLLQIFLSTVYIVLLLAFGVARGALISVLPNIVGQEVMFLTTCVTKSKSNRILKFAHQILNRRFLRKAFKQSQTPSCVDGCLANAGPRLSTWD